MSTLEFRVAIRDAIAEEMERDDRVIFIGEDIGVAGGVFKATPGLHERFGSERVLDTPISELALSSAAFGAAVTGLRPVFEIMFGDFMALPMDSLVNQSAKYWYITNEQASIPLVVRSAVGGGGRFGAVHSQTHGTWFQGVPGIKIAMPSNSAEAKGLLKGAIRDDNPVIFLEHKRLYSVKDEVPDTIEAIELGRARVAREGDDLTIVSIGKGVRDALAAAEQLDLSRRGGGPPHAAPARRRDRGRVRGEDEPPARRRGGAAHRRLGHRPARRRRRGRPARPRRRLDCRHGRDADPLLADVGGCVHAGRGRDRRLRARAFGNVNPRWVGRLEGRVAAERPQPSLPSRS